MLPFVMGSSSKQEKTARSVWTKPSQQVCLSGTPRFRNLLILRSYVQKFFPEFRCASTLKWRMWTFRSGQSVPAATYRFLEFNNFITVQGTSQLGFLWMSFKNPSSVLLLQFSNIINTVSWHFLLHRCFLLAASLHNPLLHYNEYWNMHQPIRKNETRNYCRQS